MEKQTDAPVLLCGRYFSIRELDEVQETVRMFPKLSRTELANTICEILGWVTPAGQYKIASCQQLLEKLEGQGLITLPFKQEYKTMIKRGSILGRVQRLVRWSKGILPPCRDFRAILCGESGDIK